VYGIQKKTKANKEANFLSVTSFLECTVWSAASLMLSARHGNLMLSFEYETHFETLLGRNAAYIYTFYRVNADTLQSRLKCADNKEMPDMRAGVAVSSSAGALASRLAGLFSYPPAPGLSRALFLDSSPSRGP